jgi:hypothetical protein
MDDDFATAENETDENMVSSPKERHSVLPKPSQLMV